MRTKINSLLLAAAASALLAATPAPAVQLTRPASAPAHLQPSSATIRAVTGKVEVRDNDASPWKPATPGTVLPIGAECRTGPKSSITFTMPPNQVVTLDRLTMVKILDLFTSPKAFKTNLGMKYGRTRYEVEAAGVNHDAVIQTPSSALAVRGTVVVVTDDGLGSRAIVQQGTGTYHAYNGNSYTLGTSPDSKYGDNPIQATPNSTPADVYAGQSSVPYFTSPGLSPDEQQVVSTNYTVGGLNTGILEQITPGAVGELNPAEQTGPAQGRQFGPGKLQFTLTWRAVDNTGKGRPVATQIPDLDLFVISPTKKRFVPGDFQTPPLTFGSPIVGPNDHGNNRTGHEFILWNKAWPFGLYTYGVHYAAGEDPATFKIQVTLNGHRVNPTFQDTVSPFDRDVKFSIQMPPPGSNIRPIIRARPLPSPARTLRFERPGNSVTTVRAR